MVIALGNTDDLLGSGMMENLSTRYHDNVNNEPQSPLNDLQLPHNESTLKLYDENHYTSIFKYPYFSFRSHHQRLELENNMKPSVSEHTLTMKYLGNAPIDNNDLIWDLDNQPFDLELTPTTLRKRTIRKLRGLHRSHKSRSKVPKDDVEVAYTNFIQSDLNLAYGTRKYEKLDGELERKLSANNTNI
ncbi:hypothetical protein CAAN1_09S03158 [[Candida] anglica]|uniref:Uncharacterized protein n=1 Tax=[Candida] anglica TaxID=148631 RepID=A0ABP0EFG2_9ASCO